MTSAAHTAPAVIAARALLDAGCVQFQRDEPFRLPSGWASPVYMDCRRLITFPTLRKALVQMAVARLQEDGGLDAIDSIVGAESSGIAFAAWIADALALPMQYVRKKPIGLGEQSQIEGVLPGGSRVLLVDDLMAAGHSKLRFITALRAAGAQVPKLFVIFDYGSFGAQAALDRMGITVQSLATWGDILQAARERAAGDNQSLDALGAFLSNPPKWSSDHGGIGARTAKFERTP